MINKSRLYVIVVFTLILCPLLALANPKVKTNLKSINAILIDNKVNYTLYAGTNGNGLFVSKDSGASWQQSNAVMGTLAIINALAEDKDGNIYVGTPTGVFKSDNTGTNWSQFLSTTSINSMFVDKTNTIYVGSTISGVMYKSADEGATWHDISAKNISHAIIGFVMDNKNNLYAATNGDGILKSGDAGANWTAINTGLPLLTISDIKTNKDNSGLYVVVAGKGIYDSTDGITWSLLSDNPSVTSIFIDSNNYIYSGTDGKGILRTTDNKNWLPSNNNLGDITQSTILNFNSDTFNNLYVGTLNKAGNSANIFRMLGNPAWSQSNVGLPDNTYFTSFALDHTDNSILAGDWDHPNIFKLTHSDGKSTWSLINSTGVNDLLINNNGYYLTNDSGTFNSLDKGLTWQPINTGLPKQSGIQPLHSDNQNNIYVGLTCEGVFQFDNNAKNWSRLGDQLPTCEWLRDFAVDNDKSVYTTTEAGIYKLTQGQGSWTRVNSDITGFAKIAIDQFGNIYAGGYDPRALFKSSDKGATWVRSLPLDEIESIASIAIDQNGDIYVGTAGISNGPYRSSDQGKTWVSINNGFSQYANELDKLIIDNDGDLYGANSGLGVARLTIGWKKIF